MLRFPGKQPHRLLFVNGLFWWAKK